MKFCFAYSLNFSSNTSSFTGGGKPFSFIHFFFSALFVFYPTSKTPLSNLVGLISTGGIYYSGAKFFSRYISYFSGVKSLTSSFLTSITSGITGLGGGLRGAGGDTYQFNLNLISIEAIPLNG